MTFAELKVQIEKMTETQLAMPVLWASENIGGEIGETWILEEDHINLGDGLEPAASYHPEDLERKRVWPAGTVILCDR